MICSKTGSSSIVNTMRKVSTGKTYSDAFKPSGSDCGIFSTN